MAASIISFVASARAPARPLSFRTINSVWRTAGWPGVVTIALVALCIALALQPLQFRLVQVMEGYWHSARLDWLFARGLRRQHRRRREQNSRAQVSGTVTQEDLARMVAASESLRSYFPAEDRLLPTMLGNALRAAEDRAASRWGADAVTLWPRLFPLLPSEYAQSVEDEVIQLDLSARLTVTWLFTAVVCFLAMLARPLGFAHHPQWIAVPIGLTGMSWLSYRGAVESALASGKDLEVAIDLYKGRLLQSLRFPQPGGIREEQRLLSTMTDLLQVYEPERTPAVRYTRPRTPHRDDQP